MTKTIKILLTNAATGTWTTESGYTIVTGVTIPENRDAEQVADAMLPHIERAYGAAQDVLIIAIDPNGTDIAGQRTEGGEPVCQFHVLNGQIEAQG